MASIYDNKAVLYYAQVVGTKDPLKLGRVQVKLSSLDKPVEMPWIRVLQSQATKSGKGTLVLPESGDIVAILRGAGDHIGSMLVLGGVYDNKNKPGFPKQLAKNDYKYIQTREGHVVLLSDEKGKTKIEIKSAKGLTMLFDDKTKLIDMKAVAVQLTMDGKGKAFKVSSPATVLIKAKDITLQGSNSVTIKGKTVKIAGQFAVDIKGKDVKIKSQMNTKIGGLKIDIKAGLMCKVGGVKVSVKGAMTSIG